MLNDKSGILLQTKFRMPVLKSGVSDRERLNKYAATILSTPLTLVRAPAGYGKTTFLQQCARQLAAHSIKLVWVGYDVEDNRTDIALAYFVAALGYACKPIAGKLKHHFEAYREGAEQQLLTAIINILDEWRQPIVIMLDDLHTITNSTVHESFRFFIKNMPDTVRCILASRETLPWGFTNLPSNEYLAIIDADTLRFTASETMQLLNDVQAQNIDATVVQGITDKTEGWIAAIQLFAASLHKTGQHIHLDRHLSGKNKLLFDYLAEVTLQNLDDETLAFLLQTAPLGRFTVELCSLITGFDNVADIIGRLDAENLFLVPLDNEQTWFRFHALFNEFLLTKLQQDKRFDRKVIHATASKWFSGADLPIEAMHHALAAEDMEQVSQLLDSAARRSVRYSQRNLLVSWLEHISPDTILKAGVNATLAIIWSHISAREFEKASALVQKADEILSASEPPEYGKILPQDRPCLELAKVAIQRYEQPEKDNSNRVREIYSSLKSNWYLERAIADGEMGYIHWQRNELERAYVAFLEARAQTEAAQYHSLLADAMSCMADIRLQQGRLKDSYRLAEETMDRLGEQAGMDIPATGHSQLILAEILFEQGEIDKVPAQLKSAENLVNLRGMPELILRSKLLRAKLEASEYTPEKKAEHFLKIGALSLHEDVNDATHQLYALQIWSLIEAGQLEMAEAILLKHGMPLSSPGPSPQFKVKTAKEHLYLALGYFHLAQQNFLPALNWFRFMAAWARRSGKNVSLARTQGLLAVCYLGQKRHDDAMRAIREMVMIAEQYELHTSIITLAPQIDALIQDYCAIRQQQFEQGDVASAPSYAAKLIGLASPDTKQPGAHDPEEGDGLDREDDYIESLTDREKEILLLIEKGLKNQEIADELLIAITSVKWHVKNIFAKLDVKRRTQAVAKARSLKILS